MNTSMKRGCISILILGVAVLVLANCTAHRKPSSVEKALANAAKDVVIPLEAENLKNPLDSSPETIQKGSETYQRSCSLCHSADGHAHNQLGEAMYPPAMDLTSPHVQHWTEGELFWIIQNGVSLTGMPSWKSMLTPEETWQVVIYIKSLPNVSPELQAAEKSESQPQQMSEAQQMAYGKTLYRQEGCFTCHRLNGQGGAIGPDLSVEGTRGRSRDWLIGHFRDPQKYTAGSVMPPFKNLTEDQLQALTTFLENQKQR